MKRFKLPSGLFVTGTDTDIGKTLVSAVLMAGTRGTYWKPIQSGLAEITDTQWVQAVTGLPGRHFLPETHRLSQPLSPHASAALDGVRIDLSDFSLPDPLPHHFIVEGAGGLMVPLNEHHFMADLMTRLALPVLLVASSGLGTINHTLLSLEKLRSLGLEIVGVVLNGPLNDSNHRAIEHYGRTRVVARIEPQSVINNAVLSDIFNKTFSC